MAHELVMYTRTLGCPFVSLARRVLADAGISYREVFIDKDPQARARLLEWVGFLSVPTLIVAEAGSVLPVSAPSPLPPGSSPRGIDRGSMITEPDAAQLNAWLVRNHLVDEAAPRA